MSDLISVSNLLKNSAQIEFTHTDGTVGTYINVNAVKFEQQYNLIDAEPVRHGHWDVVTVGTNFNTDRLCRNCKKTIKSNYWCYCPNCGARMDEE